MFNHVFFYIKLRFFPIPHAFHELLVWIILESYHINSVISVPFTQVNVYDVLLYWNEMKPTAIESSVELIGTQWAWIYFVLV